MKVIRKAKLNAKQYVSGKVTSGKCKHCLLGKCHDDYHTCAR